MSLTLVLIVVAIGWKFRPAPVRIRALTGPLPQDHEVIRALPDTIGLLTVAVHAGLSPELALRRVGRFLPPPFDTAIASVLLAVDRGARFAEATDTLLALLGESARPLARALAATERLGLPLAPALDQAAEQARNNRRRQSEQSARRLPVLLCFPLVTCILPAFVLLTVVPALLGALSALN